MDGQRWDASRLRLAEVVRASAAFPGIPPRRLVFFPARGWPRRTPRLRRIRGTEGRSSYFQKPLTDDLRRQLDQEEEEQDRRHPRAALLADGGLWNNLGTQVLREDRFVGRDHGVPPDRMLCINASAPLKPSRPLQYYVPGVAVLAWLFRCLGILNANTVVPRTHSMASALGGRISQLRRASALDPLDVVVDMRTVAEMEFELELLSRHRHDIAASDPKLVDWQRDVAEECADWADRRISRSEGSDADTLAERVEDLFRRMPSGNWHEPGLISHDDIDALTHVASWQRVKDWSDGRVDAPTTLGRLDQDSARRLVARGYLNTYMMSWLIEPPEHADEEIVQLAGLPNRIEGLLP